MRTRIVACLLAVFFCAGSALAMQATEPEGGSLGLLEVFASLTVLAAFVVAVAEALVKAINAAFKVLLDGFPAKLFSWAVSIALCIVAAYFKLGFFADVVTVYSVTVTGSLVGLVVGFIANGFFNGDVAIAVLEMMKIRIPAPSSVKKISA